MEEILTDIVLAERSIDPMPAVLCPFADHMVTGTFGQLTAHIEYCRNVSDNPDSATLFDIIGYVTQHQKRVHIAATPTFR